jgi:hypothetical protein
MIIWIASYPRSGNRYFRALLKKLYGIQHKENHAFTPESLAQAAAAAERHYVKTHELPGSDRHAAVYLLRDGRDTLVSYAWFLLQVRQNKDEIAPAEFRGMLEQLIHSAHPQFGDWSDNVRAWRKRANATVVRYEDLVREPRELVMQVVGQLDPDLPLRPDAFVPTFEEMKQLNPKVVRRGKVGSWQDEFPEDLLPAFWRRHGTMMREVGYGEEKSQAA